MKSRKNPPKPQADNSNTELGAAKIGLISAIIVAAITVIGTVLSAYFSLQAAQAPIIVPIQATQTAEAKAVLTVGTSTLTAQVPANPTSTEEAVTVHTSLPDELTPPFSPTNSNEPTTPSRVPLSNPGCSPTVDLGVLMQCEITESGFIDIHTFEATQGDPFYVKVINGGITVLDPTGQPVIPEYFDSSEIRVTTPTSGRYTINISTDIGTYWLYVQSMSNPFNTQTISVGQKISDTISTAFQHNAYTFKATADQSVVIVMTPVPVSSPLNLQFIVLSPDGTKLSSGISHGSVESRFTAPITGTYFLLVNDGGYDNPGQYTIVRFQ